MGILPWKTSPFICMPGNAWRWLGRMGPAKAPSSRWWRECCRPASGEVKISGYGPRGHICIAYVPQRSQVDWRFPASVADVVMMGRIGQIGFFRWPRRSDWDTVHAALEAVDMDSLANRQIGELSGGQQQRTFLARALAQEAELVLMDEPLNGLDTPSQEAILSLLEKLRQQKITVMVATHDLGQAASHFDRVMLLNRRLIRFGSPAGSFDQREPSACL